jgi:hypothetical protein
MALAYLGSTGVLGGGVLIVGAASVEFDVADGVVDVPADWPHPTKTAPSSHKIATIVKILDIGKSSFLPFDIMITPAQDRSKPRVDDAIQSKEKARPDFI